MKQLSNQRVDEFAGEQGQSIVLIALALVGLIAMLGLAVDVGLIFARGAQLQAAVDAAALAGVTELDSTGSDGGRETADLRALQFIQANEMPIAALEADWVDESIRVRTGTSTTPIGERRFSVEADWTFDLFFLRIINRDEIQITRRAEAGHFPLADIYASRRVEDGIVSVSNQGIFGPDVCTSWGDPFSPKGRRQAENLPKPVNDDGTYSYTYRILVPKSYRENHTVLQVELFDPETHNQNIEAQDVTITHSALAQSFGVPAQVTKSCTTVNESANKRWNPCLLPTHELTLTGVTTANVVLDQINPYWIVRIDENRGTGDTSCTARRSYEEQYNTETRFELYYFIETNNGTIERVDLASYLGKRNNSDNTDLRWVTPGVTPGVDVELGSRISSFSINVEEISGRPVGDVPGILVDAATEDMYIYLDVTSVSGGSENGFEVWAGPPTSGVPDNVNERNLYILSNPDAHNSQGAVVFAVGNLPMNSNFGLRDRDVENLNPNADDPFAEHEDKLVEVDIPLIFVGPEYAGADVRISLYDPDAGATPPITFYFDSLAEEDWSVTFGEGHPGRSCFEEGEIIGGNPYSCGSEWTTPFEFTVPGVLDNCDWSQPPDPLKCTPFYGGRLIARYRGGFSDSFGWQIRVDGLPFLTE